MNLEENSFALNEGYKDNTDTFPNIPKAMKSENEHYDVDGDVINRLCSHQAKKRRNGKISEFNLTLVG